MIYITTVYARCSSLERLELWEDLEELSEYMEKPWLSNTAELRLRKCSRKTPGLVNRAGFTDRERDHGPSTRPWSQHPPSRCGPRSPSQAVDHLTVRAGAHGNQMESTRFRCQTTGSFTGRASSREGRANVPLT
uniref:Uncharacterized protein n=1 Tax=Solanum tuberosum TaxID=4113 RepID=M1DCD5_SOLTU